jgi:hypothetical protein
MQKYSISSHTYKSGWIKGITREPLEYQRTDPLPVPGLHSHNGKEKQLLKLAYNGSAKSLCKTVAKWILLLYTPALCRPLPLWICAELARIQRVGFKWLCPNPTLRLWSCTNFHFYSLELRDHAIKVPAGKSSPGPKPSSSWMQSQSKPKHSQQITAWLTQKSVNRKLDILRR